MKIRIAFVIATFMSVALIFNGCNKGSDSPTQAQNHAPIIQNISASPTIVPVGGTATATCVATDQDQDPLTYSWTCDQGSFPSDNTASSVQWQAPSGLGGSCQLSVTVSDGSATDQAAVSVQVNQAPAEPSILSPANGAVNQATSLTLSWSCSDPESDPLTYDVYFGSGSNPPLISSSQSAASYSTGTLDPGTTYYWKIKAKDNHGNSTTGSIWSFTTQGNQPPAVPLNPNPANGAINQATSLTLSWSCSDPEGDPLTYDVYFGSGSNPPLVSSSQSAASYSTTTLTPGTTYYWKIVAKDNHGNSTTGSIWSFTTQGNQPPAEPSNPNPANGATNQSINPTLTWSCSDPESDPLTYDVYFGSGSNPPLVSSNQAAASYSTGTLDPSTTYYWKIKAKDDHSNSTTGSIWSFTTGVDNQPPLPPSNPNPANGAVNQAISLTMTWSCSDPESDPLTYDVYFGSGSNPPLVSSSQSATSYSTGTLDPGTTYYWKIKAKDDHSNSTTGSIWSFTTGVDNQPPAEPSNPNPANGAVNQAISLTMTWSCSDPESDPLTYDVYFGSGSNPPLVSSSQSATSYSTGTLDPGTTYYWKIKAKDNQGNSTTGDIWSFTTGTGSQPPLPPSSPNPANGAINQAISLTMTWSCSDPEGDPLTYDVYFGSGSNPPLVSSSQSAASYSTGTLDPGTTYYWKIVAKDDHGNSTAGPVWSFSTESIGSITIEWDASEDAWTWNAYPDSNGGSLDYLWIGVEDGVWESYVDFPTEEIPSNVQVISAELSFYAHGTAGETPFSVYIGWIDGPWDEMSITWNNFPSAWYISSHTWSIPAMNYNDPISFTVTDEVQELLNDGINEGFVLWATDESGSDHRASFRSSETEGQPHLKIVYQVTSANAGGASSQPQRQSKRHF